MTTSQLSLSLANQRHSMLDLQNSTELLTTIQQLQKDLEQLRLKYTNRTQDLRSMVDSSLRAFTPATTMSTSPALSPSTIKPESLFFTQQKPHTDNSDPDCLTLNLLYKTILCRHFVKKGRCPIGGACQFAHGHVELRSISDHALYKARDCRLQKSCNICPYGENCFYYHCESERLFYLRRRINRRYLCEKATTTTAVMGDTDVDADTVDSAGYPSTLLALPQSLSVAAPPKARCNETFSEDDWISIFDEIRRLA